MATQEQTGSDLIDQARQGAPRAIARLISQAENSPTAAQRIVGALYPTTGRAHIVGITGPPGSGKSTLVNELAKAIRRRDGRRVAIVAVDPSSPFTGGALLGDRIRMRDLSGDAGIFVRSMASRGRLGGLAEATSAAVKILDAAGYEVILVETVGAGQAEVDIAAAAHTTVVLEAPGMGDDIQSIKAGILEIADLLVVNKADRPGANRTAKALEMMLHLAMPADAGHHHVASNTLPVAGSKLQVTGDTLPGAGGRPSDEPRATDDASLPAPSPQTPIPSPHRRPDERQSAGATTGRLDDKTTGRSAVPWSVPVLLTVATTGEGVDELAATIDRHAGWLRASGEWDRREAARSRAEIEQHLRDRFLRELEARVGEGERGALLAQVVARDLDPYSAAAQLMDRAERISNR